MMSVSVRVRLLNGLLLVVGFGIAYAFFILSFTEWLHRSEDGDITSYVNYLERCDLYCTSELLFYNGDSIFRFGVNFVKDKFDSHTITVLSSISFLCSFSLLGLFIFRARNRYFFYFTLPLIFMVFFSPAVVVALSDQLRSTLAFTIFMAGAVCSSAALRYVLFTCAASLHLATVPIIGLYFLFHTLRNINLRPLFATHIAVPVLSGIFLSGFAVAFDFNVTSVSQGLSFNIAIIYLIALMTVTIRMAVPDSYGFIAVALMVSYVSGQLIGVSFVRYIAYSILAYLFFLINCGQPNIVRIFTVGYIPFFILTSYYKISNFGLSFS